MSGFSPLWLSGTTGQAKETRIANAPSRANFASYYVVKQLGGASGDFWWKSSRKAWYRPQRHLDHAANWIVLASRRQRHTISATMIRRCMTGTRSWLQGEFALMSSSSRAVESSCFPDYTTLCVAPAGSYPKLAHRRPWLFSARGGDRAHGREMKQSRLPGAAPGEWLR